WRYLLQLLRYRPLLWGLNLVGITCSLLLELGSGLLVREYFNLLTGSAPVRFGLTALLALMVAVSVARFFSSFSLGLTNIPLTFHLGGLMRRNLLARILDRPGARPLPESPGEAVN